MFVLLRRSGWRNTDIEFLSFTKTRELAEKFKEMYPSSEIKEIPEFNGFTDEKKNFHVTIPFSDRFRVICRQIDFDKKIDPMITFSLMHSSFEMTIHSDSENSAIDEVFSIRECLMPKILIMKEVHGKCKDDLIIEKNFSKTTTSYEIYEVKEKVDFGL